MNSINLLIVIFACLGYTQATLRGFPFQANDYMLKSSESSDYETICSKRPPCENYEIVNGYDECQRGREIGIGVWTANPDCCNDVPHTCLPSESTCEFDNEDVEYWHCLYCCRRPIPSINFE